MDRRAQAAMLLIVAYLSLVSAGYLRDVPKQPDYFKNKVQPYIAEDRFTFHPNFIIDNFAGTRDSRWNTDVSKVQEGSVAAGGVDFDYSSFSSTGYTTVSGGQNISANEAKFTGVYGLAGFNETGDVYITDYCVIRRVDAAGIITVYAGSFYDTYRATYYDDIFIQQMGQSCGYNYDDIPALEAMLGFPYGLATDHHGNLYIADTENLRIRKVDVNTKNISTLAGFGHGGKRMEDSIGLPADEVYIEYPITIAVGGNILYYVHIHAIIAGIDLTTGLMYRWFPAGLQVPEYNSMWVDTGRNVLYYSGRVGGEGLAIFNLSAPGLVGDTPLQWYGTLNTREDYVVHSVTGDRFGNLYWSSSKSVLSENGLVKNRKCRISFFNLLESQEYTLAGNGHGQGNCGWSEVGEPAINSKVMPSFAIMINRDGSVLFAQTNQFVLNSTFLDMDKPFYNAGVMSLSLQQPTSQPTLQPSSQPSSRPTRQPSSQPSRQPSVQPTRQPTASPTSQPSTQPSVQPTSRPSTQPTSQPSGQPSRQPSSQPSRQPSRQPTGQPSRQPSGQPSAQPTRQPSGQPSRQPSRQPTAQPSRQPTRRPTGQPTRQPSTRPTSQPSGSPTSFPTMQPSAEPSSQPSTQPTFMPTNDIVRLTRGEITGAVVGAVIGAAMLATLTYFAIASYRGKYWVYNGGGQRV